MIDVAGLFPSISRRCIAITVSSALLSSTALAVEPGADAVERAAEHDRRGRQAFVEGRYEDCIREYKKAAIELQSERYAYNIAKCSERAQELSQAIEYYRRYLALAEGAEDAEEVRLLVRVLEEQERAQRVGAPCQRGRSRRRRLERPR
jgi:tetratricopeptide (TPR) repeat protein